MHSQNLQSLFLLFTVLEKPLLCAFLHFLTLIQVNFVFLYLKPAFWCRQDIQKKKKKRAFVVERIELATVNPLCKGQRITGSCRLFTKYLLSLRKFSVYQFVALW